MIILLPDDLEHDQVEIKADTALVVQGLESLESEMWQKGRKGFGLGLGQACVSINYLQSGS